jgi:N-acetyl-gamma-glutamyl-phosphate reductase/acetylglutamate kinase
MQETITRLLYSIGTKREVERYLRIFSSSSNPSQPAKFAVIKVGGGVLGQLNELALSLSFLYRVGLYPVILHGGGPQLNEIIERGGVVPEYIDGIRVTGALFLPLPPSPLILSKTQKPYKLLAVYSWMRI